jgi:hypothetical protein
MSEPTEGGRITRYMMEIERLERKLKAEKRNSLDWFKRYEKQRLRAEAAEKELQRLTQERELRGLRGLWANWLPSL